MNTTITASSSAATISEPSKGYGSADYVTTLTVGGRKIEIPCWAHCGWLAPGAHADLDGSGLSVWGDSQLGGWSVYDGRPRVIADRSPSCDTPITVGATHLDVRKVTPDMAPEWAAALAALAATPEDADEWIDRESDAADARAEVVASLEATLDEISCDCNEPTAAEVWDALGHAAEVESAECVRVGRWIGCPLVAWREGGRVGYDWWPTSAPAGAVEAARRAAADTAATAVEDAVASALTDADND